MPGGGPVDEQPPWLVAAYPESATTGVGPIDELQFGFSEKMDRQDAFRWLTTYPRRTVRKTSWDGARVAKVELEEPLPADTVVVVELAPGMRDAHRVPQDRGRTFVFATGDSVPDGEITGTLLLGEDPLRDGVVEIYADGPDSVRVERRPVLRRALTDSTGAWTLRWLPADGHGWLLRAFQDGNNDRHAGEREAERLWPDTLRLWPEHRRLDVGERVLFAPGTPGMLVGRLGARPDDAGPVLAQTQAIAEDDTGFVPAPSPRGWTPATLVPDTGRYTLEDAGPGLVRAVYFVDLDGDSLWTAIGDEADTLWTLEPWALIDSIQVQPGLPTEVPAPIWPDTLTPWPAPEQPADESDTTAAALATPDTTLTPVPED